MPNRIENRMANRKPACRQAGGDMANVWGLFLPFAIFLLPFVMPFAASQAPAAPAAAPSSDMTLLELESKFQREKTEYLQQNILDKILGPGKAVVIVEVEMALESRATEMGMEKRKSEKKKNE